MTTMRKDFLHFSPPMIGDDEIMEVVDTLKSDWITRGPKTQRFEKEFVDYVQAPAALALNSCTACLHLSLVALGIGKGDEVVTTPLTFAATVNVIEHVGARPVLADIDSRTLNIDPRCVEKAISSKTKAVIAVHYAGYPADLESIQEICTEFRLELIEDAAHALPARYHENLIGSSANPVAFSFYATKNMTTGDGGMLTGSPDFIEKARCLSLHGMSRDAWRRYEKSSRWYYEVHYPGFKYNMTDLQASLGIHQLKRLNEIHARRKMIAQRYSEVFGRSPSLITPPDSGSHQHAWHLYALRLNPDTLKIDRDTFILELESMNIGSSVHFIPIHLHPYYRKKYGWSADDFPIAFHNFQRLISLPLNNRMSDQDVIDVIEAVQYLVDKYQK